jgi:hypothetical protein
VLTRVAASGTFASSLLVAQKTADPAAEIFSDSFSCFEPHAAKARTRRGQIE